MNQHTVELYGEAMEFAYKACSEMGREGGVGDHIWVSLTAGRLAELIVKKCATVGNYAYDGGEYPGTMIKDYFGVE